MIIAFVILIVVMLAALVVLHFLPQQQDAEDNIESTERFFKGKYTNEAENAEAELELYFDPAWFFENQYEYNPRLATISAVLAELTYDASGVELYESDKKISDSKEPYELIGALGFQNVSAYEDNIKVFFGNQQISYNGESKTLVIVDVRGTPWTNNVKEWMSNFEATPNHNGFHTGFFTTKTTVEEKFNEYIKTNSIDAVNAIYWVTGHSRGAAVANLLGFDIVNKSKKGFVYTFACPNVTVLKNSKKYNCIFNIVNSDDIVTAVPKGYTRFGRDMSLSVNDLCKTENGNLDYGELKSDYIYKTVNPMKAVLKHHAGLSYYCETLFFERRTLVVCPRSKKKKQGTIDPCFDYTITCRDNIKDVIKGRLARETGEDVGTYNILCGTLNCTDKNYSIVFKGGRTLTIEKSEKNITKIALIAVAAGAGIAAIAVLLALIIIKLSQ